MSFNSLVCYFAQLNPETEKYPWSRVGVAMPGPTEQVSEHHLSQGGRNGVLHQTFDSTSQSAPCTNLRGVQSIGNSSVSGKTPVHTPNLYCLEALSPHHNLGGLQRGARESGAPACWLDVVEVQDIMCLCQSVQSLCLGLKTRRSPEDPDLMATFG